MSNGAVTSLLSPAHAALIMQGLKLTLLMSLVTWVIAAIVGVILAVLHEGGGRLAKIGVGTFVAYQRNNPALAHILLWYFGVPAILPVAAQTWINAHNGEFLLSSVAMGLLAGAYFCEDIRSGFRAVHSGQSEASRALGFSYVQSMRYIILPQALRIALPPLINHTVLLFKNTSLAMAVGAMELTYVIREIENETFRTFGAYLIATIIYLAISLGLMAIGAGLDRRYSIPAR